MRSEIIETISATNLARNMAQTIDHVRINRSIMLITKGNKVIAKLSPPPKNGLSVSDLAKLITSLPKLGNEDSLKMSDDLKTIRATAKLPENPWD